MTDTTQKWIAVDMFTGEVMTTSSVSRVVIRHQEIFEQLATICKMTPERDAETGAYEWRRMTKAERGMLNRCAKELYDASATDDEIGGFTAWWTIHDWRGRNRQPPGPWDVVKNWTRYRAHGARNVGEEWQAAIDAERGR